MEKLRRATSVQPDFQQKERLRRIALNLARADTTLKASLKGKRKSAAWDNTFMAILING